MAEVPGPYHIVLCTGLDRDLRYLAVLIRSIVRHFSRPDALRFHFLHFQLSEKELRRFEESVRDLPCPPPVLYPLDDVLGARVHKPGFGYYAWLWFSEELPDDIERFLYLDSDMLCYADLRPLWDIELGDSVCAMVPDPGGHVHDCARDLNETAPRFGFSFPLSRTYFNAGLVFADFQTWKRLQIPQTIEKHFSEDYEALRLWDQGALNLILDEVYTLSPEWNLIESVVLYENWDFELYRDFVPQQYFQPRLRHFSGKMKPDGPDVRASEARDFYEYLDETAWRGWRSVESRHLARTVKGHLLDFHYVVVRGLRQKVLDSPWKRMMNVVARAPFVLFLYPLLPLYRAFLKLGRA